MPQDVAMQRPHSRIVGQESEHQPPGLGQRGCVPEWRINEVESCRLCGVAHVEGPNSTAKDPEVVAVETAIEEKDICSILRNWIRFAWLLC